MAIYAAMGRENEVQSAWPMEQRIPLGNHVVTDESISSLTEFQLHRNEVVIGTLE